LQLNARSAFPVRSAEHASGFWNGLAAHSCGGSHGFGPFWVRLTVFPFNPPHRLIGGTIEPQLRNLHPLCKPFCFQGEMLQGMSLFPGVTFFRRQERARRKSASRNVHMNEAWQSSERHRVLIVTPMRGLLSGH